VLWFFIDERGAVENVQVNQSSGHQPLDQAALRVGRVFQFRPARNQDREAPVCIAIPMTFQGDVLPRRRSPPAYVAETVSEPRPPCRRPTGRTGWAPGHR
jgi:TonB family protein